MVFTAVAWQLVHGWIASALLGTARRKHRFVYDCVIAERVSLLQSLYGVNTPQYYYLSNFSNNKIQSS
jgi:hypothetical protein